MKKTIYMDYSATTPVLKEVVEEMMPYFTEFYGNPASIYSLSNESKMAIDEAKITVSKIINCKPYEIFFTSGGSEGDSWAIIGSAFANRDKGKHIITTAIEHHAVLNSCKFLEGEGFEVTYLNVDSNGLVSIEELKKNIRKDTILVSIMMANNEIGTIEPVKEIGDYLKGKNIIFHTDAVQAAGHVKIDVDQINADLLSLAAHKFYGPKGIGILYIRKGTKVSNIIYGGGQQRGRRGGTENVPAIVGAAKALKIVSDDIEKENTRQENLRNLFVEKALELPYVKLNGILNEKRLSNNINLCFNGKDGEGILFNLDMNGICASAGSACQAGAMEASHVLTAIGLSKEEARSSIRFTIGRFTTEEEILYVVDKLKELTS
ncbi:cysteine desulfurase [Clostridium acetobutylicum]|uniref:NifS family enzyme (Cysteine desulfurase/cysteine sulfinate desulfinase) n=1 Tax=Clostridium acetobutylicum (strain ATCC 824 / DSM 792 / JCM 1419 / IAM 19013 / LMG 5710 / NBRC 13948 / NRRL B-527 / VKM B-1787 / 2291 / W) TaxID=272562 RepID=Q97GY1_CLOAB|nr:MULTISPECIES: cysteine desulfurase family protein [Clostridium]AAK80191.1 NifS family enzyme (cysteine desulfurase/cysteine sulfinate desulfinase) [Clostridium acetobutylicum ATCC 824]ADZ21285.1 NifS family enzyme (cysteine desulfurase/cysteine sulfinate desulfinase) [Clostridium acetobutylicum EA 2018]AEI34639.1 cysteine desulfurase/cysteine sulfinate desulfinase [Clostridium acetobutylicum DSM 1731]AWV79384.1 cysteine desulfurase [Clostridium acetobutylicum]MBC2394645.1 cysteine desulfura